MPPNVSLAHAPVLDPGFLPASKWNRAFRERVAATPGSSTDLAIGLEQPGGSLSVTRTRILPHVGEGIALNETHVERMVKFLLWQRGGSRLLIGGSPEIARMLQEKYSPSGLRHFDAKFIGEKIYREPLRVESLALEAMPGERQPTVALGRHLKGCRIGFDLGGSDRKTSAVMDGKVVFTEEVPWDPYFQKDPQYHLEGIRHSLARAAAHLPRVDAIGGSAAGCYVDNEVRAASLFRGVSEADFESKVRRMFHQLRAEWNNVPFEVVNDGEVTALAGSMSLNDNCVLGISMGTSEAAGYVDGDGHITTWLNELAFAPVDYRADAPADEWSGDVGCGVQYFSQQAVARLAPKAGIAFAAEIPFAERLVEVQRLMKAGDERAAAIYDTIGTCFGYAIAGYAEFYTIRNILVLGRVTSGEGGEILLKKAATVLREEFPELAGIALRTPDEQMKRHGQAVAAASLPAI
ncbi:MAG: ROK family protein [Verrucomicrobiales bacterium]|nr:ROK family protein [Verrucomicrobiales bacterium]